MKSKAKVAVMLSGGVDSAVAAALLQKRGFWVMGIFMKNWSIDVGQGCPWVEDQRSARRVAAHLGIPFFTFNFEKEYKEQVVGYFLKEYALGRTPNPDIVCNKDIKFHAFINKARGLGITTVATGHYARIQRRAAGPALLAGIDPKKDQSYFLYRLKPSILEHVLFPIGAFKKSEVRALARRLHLPNAERKDSQGICFMGEVPVRQFILNKLQPEPGQILSVKGSVLGTHQGLSLYTIGQRHGLQLGGSIPYYVAQKNPKSNTIVVVKGRQAPELYSRTVSIRDWSQTSAGTYHLPLECKARIRYQQPLEAARLSMGRRANSRLLTFKRPQFAVAPGQSVVVYKGVSVVGGGIIC